MLSAIIKETLCIDDACILGVFLNSSWPHAFARIMARERQAAHGPNSRDCWSPGEPARVQPPISPGHLDTALLGH